jgi:hypothetical protein
VFARFQQSLHPGKIRLPLRTIAGVVESRLFLRRKSANAFYYIKTTDDNPFISPVGQSKSPRHLPGQFNRVTSEAFAVAPAVYLPIVPTPALPLL